MQEVPIKFARGCGCTPDETEIRGCWKTQGQCIDAVVAGLLCVNGPIKHKFVEGVVLMDEWLFEHVVPSIRRCFPNDSRLCGVLATAILWAAMDEATQHMMPPAMHA